MTEEEWELFVELALAVHEMAPPDRQRRISRAMQAMEDANRAHDESQEPPTS